MATRETGSRELEGALLRGMREAVAVARGKVKPTRVYTLARLKADEQSIAPPPAYTKSSIVAIRERMGVSQPIFASVLNVSTATVRGWEQGVREPEGPSLRLLELAERQPAALLEMAGIRGVMPQIAKRRGAGRAGTAKRGSALARHK